MISAIILLGIFLLSLFTVYKSGEESGEKSQNEEVLKNVSKAKCIDDAILDDDYAKRVQDEYTK